MWYCGVLGSWQRSRSNDKLPCLHGVTRFSTTSKYGTIVTDNESQIFLFDICPTSRREVRWPVADPEETKELPQTHDRLKKSCESCCRIVTQCFDLVSDKICRLFATS